MLEGYYGIHVLAGRGQGISLFIRNDRKVSGKPIILNQHNVQIIRVKLENVTIVVVYRSPSFNSQDFLTNELLNILPTKGPTVVIGDFNIHPKEKNSYFDQLVEKMASKGFKQYIDMPTHRDGHILDHMYVREIEMHGWLLHHPYYSDHDAICLMAKL